MGSSHLSLYRSTAPALAVNSCCPLPIAVRDRMVPPPPPPHRLCAKANTSSSIFLHWRRPAFTTAQVINYTVRCNPVGLQNASLVLYLQTYVACLPGCLLGAPGCSRFLLTRAQLGLHPGALASEPMISNVWKFRFSSFIRFWKLFFLDVN